MDHHKIISELTRNSQVFHDLLKDSSKEMVLWKPAPDKWCLLEIVCHLHDEECEDFRARVKHVLECPNEPMPPFDPLDLVKARNYIGQDFQVMLDKFSEERSRSLKWLSSLKAPNWDNSYQHPKLGPMSAELFLTNWLAHDYIHIRQILKVKFAYLQQSTNEPLSYAGSW
ncbi:DinB family protein [Aureitalea sp. L0-47]|uniref:DinB family protein n=1 Tax=Aureitalea sp. L0-47 TaxID=2816962 RepID=UPI0022389E39|nr:DinB family protein [Aureitalea sp. L0-47]MCW5520553.1 DinB family protein [Aureitalea sp. L0-47]